MRRRASWEGYGEESKHSSLLCLHLHFFPETHSAHTHTDTHTHTHTKTHTTHTKQTHTHSERSRGPCAYITSLLCISSVPKPPPCFCVLVFTLHLLVCCVISTFDTSDNKWCLLLHVHPTILPLLFGIALLFWDFDAKLVVLADLFIAGLRPVAHT